MDIKISTNKIYTLLILSIIILPLDQLTKYWARKELSEPKLYFGNNIGFELTSNSGSAFSLFAGSTIYVSVLAFVIITALIVAFFYSKENIPTYTYAVIAIGAIGNLIDRFTQAPFNGKGHVTDFIKLFSWPTFNIADMAITLGAVTLILSAVLTKGHKHG